MSDVPDAAQECVVFERVPALARRNPSCECLLLSLNLLRLGR